MSNTYTAIDLSTVRSTQSEGMHWFCLTDLSTALGCDSDDSDLMGAYIDVSEQHRAIRTLYRADGTEEFLPVISLEGLARLLLESPPRPFAELAVSVLVSGLASRLLPQPHAAVRADRPATVWGEQPVRALMRGLGMSVAQVATAVSSVPGQPFMLVKASTLNSVLLGRSLPSKEVFLRLKYVFQQRPGQLFTPEVLAAVEKKHGVGASSPSHTPLSTPPSPPLPLSPGLPSATPSYAEPDELGTPSFVAVSEDSPEMSILSEAEMLEAFREPLFDDQSASPGQGA